MKKTKKIPPPPAPRPVPRRVVHLELNGQRLALTASQYEACCRTLVERLAFGRATLVDHVAARLLANVEEAYIGAVQDGAAPGTSAELLDYGAQFDRFYERVSREDFDEARAILADLEAAFGRSDPDIVQACWSLDAEDV